MAEPTQPMTVRVPQYVVDYRNKVCSRDGRLKNRFDKEVFDFYIQHHPLDAKDATTPATQKEQ